MWSSFVGFLKDLLFSYVVPFISKAIAASTGFPTFLITIALKWIGKKAVKEAESAARLKDQENIDVKNDAKYKTDIQNGASHETIIQDELDILNGHKPK